MARMIEYICNYFEFMCRACFRHDIRRFYFPKTKYYFTKETNCLQRLFRNWIKLTRKSAPLARSQHISNNFTNIVIVNHKTNKVVLNYVLAIIYQLTCKNELLHQLLSNPINSPWTFKYRMANWFWSNQLVITQRANWC